MGELGFTQDMMASTKTKALKAEITSWAKPTRPTQGNKATGPCPPESNHSKKYCNMTINQAPTRLDRSHDDQAGITLRRGKISQSVMENTKRPKGWWKEMRCHCIKNRNRHVPATKPATTSKTMLTN